MNIQFKRFVGYLLLLILSPAICANQDTQHLTPQSQKLLQSLQDDVRKTLSLIAREQLKQGQTIEQFQYTLDLPASYKIDLGLILEMNDKQSALLVVSVTPGSLASSQGLAIADEIVSVDGVRVSARSEADILERLQRLNTGEDLSLMVSRQSVTQGVLIPVTGRFIPRIKLEIGNHLKNQEPLTPVEKSDARACGRITVLMDSSESNDLHSVSIYRVDENHAMEAQSNLKLAVGNHTVYVHERISDDHFSNLIERERKPRAIQIDVKADTNYHLGSKLIAEGDVELVNGEYWQAVIWKATKQGCQL